MKWIKIFYEFYILNDEGFCSLKKLLVFHITNADNQIFMKRRIRTTKSLLEVAQPFCLERRSASRLGLTVVSLFFPQQYFKYSQISYVGSQPSDASGSAGGESPPGQQSSDLQDMVIEPDIALRSSPELYALDSQASPGQSPKCCSFGFSCFSFF